MVSIIVAVSVVLLIIVIWRSRALIKHYNISGDPAGAMQRVVVEQPSMNDTTARRFSDSGICLNILKGTTYSSDESLGTNKLSLLVSRAIPKQRLVRAFGIDNGFTTFDPEKRADFLSEARERLAEVTRYGWEGIASTAEDVTEKPSTDLEWREILQAFCHKPDKQQFEQRGAGLDSVSVQFLVYEALRLYPPTRRIYRQMHMSTITEPELIAADIEACHRLPEIWGDDSHQYHPGRWNSVNRHMRKAFMPFGGPPYQCPVSASFGPMMIGVLVAVIASELSPTVWRLSYGEERSVSRVLNDEMELNPGRSEKTSWFPLRESRDMGSHQSHSDE